MSRVLSSLILCLLVNFLSAQSNLFVPRNYEKAYEAGSRAWNGKPGPNYWQNRANYKIQVNLDPATRFLSGTETIVYRNESPDTLKRVRIKLQHDRYRKGATRAYDVTAVDVEDEGTVLESVAYNGVEVPKDQQRRNATFLDLILRDNPIPPNSEATFGFKWSYTIPPDGAREFALDSSFLIPYWYPQIAVYDDIRGWASFPYTGQQEFYHDFSDYEVAVTVPNGFQVWATGEWQNAKDILQAEYLDRWNKAHTATVEYVIFSEDEIKSGKVFKKGKSHTFSFVAKDVPDFVFAASNSYNWNATSVVVDDATRRRTFVSAVFNSKSSDYREVVDIAARGIRLMSTWLPGYPFPYPVMTIFNGNDGMEYPMMCNDASTAPRSPMMLTVHEVSHTYFPFMMGINEQEYAWMDEGWAAFFDYMLCDSLSGHKLGRIRDYSSIAGTDEDVPPMVRSSNLSSAYRNASYQRPQSAYLTLLDLLGYETFHKCMKEYMNRWKSKHPAPFDFFQTWNDVSGQNLDWYWKPWFFEWAYPDLGIQGVVKDEAANCSVIMIERKGNLPVPLHAEIKYADGSNETFHRNAAVWKDGKQNFNIRCAEGKNVQSVKLGLETIPDSVPEDNVWEK
ncbi:MAG: M1 family metallopeptidase [Lewinellaceae bacterium]|nr:M1 family metallopeptidase [Lewinellaceae bacterium]